MTDTGHQHPPLGSSPQEAREFSDWHESTVQHPLRNSGLDAQREPHIMRKTPDLLIHTPDGEPFVVECIARLPNPQQRDGQQCCDDIVNLHQNLYSRLQHKATKYRSIAERLPYVIALYDGACTAGVDTALDLALSPYAPTVSRADDGRPQGRRYDRLWRTPHIPVALFELYQHVSGMIYSTWPAEHHYLPNPHARRPVAPEMFPFAQVPPLPARYRHHQWPQRPATVLDDAPPPPGSWLQILTSTPWTAPSPA